MTDLRKAAREALIAWWEEHRPMGWTAEQHRAQPTVNAQSETDKPLMEIAAAASRAALDEAPGEEREAFEAWWAGLCPVPYYPGIEKLIARNAWQARAMLAARPSVPQGEPVAHLWQHSETGRTRVVMPDQIITADASWRVVGPLYLAARPSAPTVALTEEQRRKCWCETCRPVSMYPPEDMRMPLCPDCGNKRCPRANDHRNACTGSNEPGQHGSAYPVRQAEGKEGGA